MSGLTPVHDLTCMGSFIQTFFYANKISSKYIEFIYYLDLRKNNYGSKRVHTCQTLLYK